MIIIIIRVSNEWPLKIVIIKGKDIINKYYKFICLKLLWNIQSLTKSVTK